MSLTQPGLSVVPSPGTSQRGSYIATQDGSTSQLFNGTIPSGIIGDMTPWYTQPYNPSGIYVPFVITSITGIFSIAITSPSGQIAYTPITPDSDGVFRYTPGQQLNSPTGGLLGAEVVGENLASSSLSPWAAFAIGIGGLLIIGLIVYGIIKISAYMAYRNVEWDNDYILDNISDNKTIVAQQRAYADQVLRQLRTPLVDAAY